LPWQAYVITSSERVRNGDFIRFFESSGFSENEVVLGYRGDSSDCPAGFTRTVNLPRKISLSNARNTLLEAFPPTMGAFVAFPDDDCWYTPSTVKTAEKILNHADFVIGVVDREGTENDEYSYQQRVDTNLALRKSASAAIFCRSEAILGFRFDEALGLGARYKAAEDLDLVLYMLSEKLVGIFNESLRVGHPDNGRTFEYFPGSIAAMRKHISVWPHFVILILRRLAHGLLTGSLEN
jgi:Glycosyl transferase family 2